VPRERAAEFAERFHTLVEEFNSHPNTTEGDIVHANLLAMFYATEADEAPGLERVDECVHGLRIQIMTLARSAADS
jgi:hypothetical protein